jgi:hypothetical protein
MFSNLTVKFLLHCTPSMESTIFPKETHVLRFQLFQLVKSLPGVGAPRTKSFECIGSLAPFAVEEGRVVGSRTSKWVGGATGLRSADSIATSAAAGAGTWPRFQPHRE